MSNTQYLSCAETAKLVRAALKESFPGVKFAVRSSVYSGGASINIRYTDGPTYEQVKAVAGMFEGAYFDGMTDYKGLNFGSLDGNEVRFGADFIFVNRDFSIGFMETNVKAACEYYGYAMPTITGGGVYGAYIADRLDYETNRRIMAKVSEISLVATQESATLARAGFLGDDGYGWNSTGRMAA
jgi:hypothetical protein